LDHYLRRNCFASKIHLMQKLFNLILCFVFSVNFCAAADYYWVGGSGTWNDLSHWASSSGGPGAAYGTQPQSTDNVFFDANSGIAGGTLTFPSLSTSTCFNWTVSGAGNFTIAGTATARFDVNGSVFLQSGLNFTWIGEWWFYQSTVAAANSFETGGNLFRNEFIRFEQPSSGIGGNFLITGNFNAQNVVSGVKVALQNISDEIVFNNQCRFNTATIVVNAGARVGLDVIRGTARTLSGWQRGDVLVNIGSFLYNYDDVYGNHLSAAGTVFLNAGNTANGNIINLLTLTNQRNSSNTLTNTSSINFWNNNGASLNSHLDYNNCNVLIRNAYYYGAGENNNNVNSILNASNSTLHFLNSASAFYISNHTHNNVIIDDKGLATFSIIAAGATGTISPTIDTLICYANMNYSNRIAANVNEMQITGLKRFFAGKRYSGVINRTSYHMIAGATLDMQGNCENPIFVDNITHDLNNVGVIIVDGLKMGPNTVRAFGGAAPYNPGANSELITGTNLIGWAIPIKTARTIVWVGGNTCSDLPNFVVPTLPQLQDLNISKRLNFTIAATPVQMISTEVFVTKTGTGTKQFRVEILNAAGASIYLSPNIAVPNGANNLLMTVNLGNTLLIPGEYYITLNTAHPDLVFRFNTNETYPKSIVSTDGCTVGTFLSNLPLANEYSYFYSIKCQTYNNLGTINWYNSNNWVDVTALPLWASDPNIAPGNSGYLPTCPPTEIDSVIFPNLSTVYCDRNVMYTEGMNWLQEGEIIGASNQNIEIWGSLYLSPEMQNNFNGTFRFRSNRTYRCNITTSNHPFNYGVRFNSENGLGEWLLMDSLIVPTRDNEWLDENTQTSIHIEAGHLHTGTANCTPGIGQTIVAFGMSLYGGTLSLYDSDIYITGFASNGSGGNAHNFDFRNSGNLNSGTSHIIFQNQQTSSSFGGQGANYQKARLAGHVYYEISALRPIQNIPTNYSNILAFGDNARVFKLNTGPQTWPVIQSSATTAAAAPRVHFLEHHSVNPISFGLGVTSGGYTPNNGRFIEMDTFVSSNSDVVFGIQTKINGYVEFGTGITLQFNNNTTLTLSDPFSYISPFAPGCFVPSAFAFPGANMLLSGSCFGGNTQVVGGGIVVNTPLPITTQYLTVNNNVVTGLYSPLNASNSILIGTTTGWTGAPAIPRKLRWVDNTGIASNSGSWQDANYWEQLLPTYLPAPQCPPTQIDTVLFDDISFSATDQVVELNGTTDIASMYWVDIPAGQSPKLSGLTTQELVIRANLQFHENMENNQMGNFYFRGISSVLNPFTIKSSGIRFRSNIYFVADDDNTTWQLQDSLYQNVLLDATSSGTNDTRVYHLRGFLDANGHNLNIAGYHSTGNSLRSLNISNTTVTLRGRNNGGSGGGINWNVAGAPVVNGSVVPYSINTDNSTILVSTGVSRSYFQLGGKKYNRIIGGGGAQQLLPNAFRRDSINYLELPIGGTLANNSINVDSIFVGHANIFCPITINSIGGQYDTLYFKNNANITTSNRYFKLLYFQPSRNYNLTQNTVQWIANPATVELNGGNTAGTIQFYGIPTGSTAYIRKDSGFICADYVNIRDVWAIGNGNDPLGACTPNNNCPHPNLWIESSCDTITELSNPCGPWTSNPLNHNRGRADFNGGEFADFQGGNVFGWAKLPYPPAPLISLENATRTICLEDSVVLVFNGIGNVPITLVFRQNGIDTAIIIESISELSSYDPATGAFTFELVRYPVVSTVYDLGFITVERCFGGRSPDGLGLVSINVIDPCLLPLELLTFEIFSNDNRYVNLKWSTAFESENDFFTIERSKDAINWQHVSYIDAVGNSNEISEYETIDIYPYGGLSYYRLKQTDLSGKYSYAHIKAINLGENNKIEIYPNPAKDLLNIFISEQEFSVEVFNVYGQKVLESFNSKELNISSLSAGNYFVRILSDKYQMYTAKFTVKN
jgi:hypothetical protein